MRKHKKTKIYSVDRLIREIGSHLARDFRDSLPDVGINYSAVLLDGAVADVRGLDWQWRETSDPYALKRRYQMADLFKRFRFSKDLMSDGELKEAAEKQFLDNQHRLAGLDFKELPAYVSHLLLRAATIAWDILGDYDLDEHYSHCRNGKKASVGIPRRLATEAARYDAPITGSSEHIAWFQDIVMSEDDQLRDYVVGEWLEKNRNLREEGREQVPLFRDVTELALTFVPKTFKSLRSIMPNTTIGAFYSDGLGKVIQKRLKRAGYDITKLQFKHRELAQLASFTGELVTADQSLASDNITVELVRRILPRAWFNAVNLGRIECVRLPSGVRVKTPTFMTMGIGFTFPLQTLIFLVLLLAIDEEYTHGRSIVSVYGDDLIYSKEMHPFVPRVFEYVGLKMNIDKTYAEGGFRESCGGDYFAGVDVRPFLPKNEDGSLVKRSLYERLLYIYINCLLRRWSREEVPLTFDFLLEELSRECRGVLRVPSDYPDEAGVKVYSPYDVLNSTCRLVPLVHGKHGVISFHFLRFTPKVMKEQRHAPYLWRHLGQGHGDRFDGHRDFDRRMLRSSGLLRVIEELTGASKDRPTVFKWVERKRGGSRSGIPSVNQPRATDSYIPDPGGGGRVLRQAGSTVMWS